MIKKFVSLSFTKILIFSLAFVLAAQTAFGAVSALRENIDRKNGAIKTQSLSFYDFKAESIAEREIGGEIKYVSTDADPQLILTFDGKMTGMKFYMDSTMPTGEVVVYYTLSTDEDFSEKNKVWAKPEGNGIYSFTLSEKYIHTLRIDPTIFGGNFMTFGEFVVNPKRNFSDYLSFGYENLPFIVMYTGILASIIRFVQEIFTKKSDKLYKN